LEYELINSILSLGVGGVLGIIIFLMYRKDRKDTEERWRDMVKDLIEVREQENITRLGMTKALTELVILIRRVNGKAGRERTWPEE